MGKLYAKRTASSSWDLINGYTMDGPPNVQYAKDGSTWQNIITGLNGRKKIDCKNTYLRSAIRIGRSGQGKILNMSSNYASDDIGLEYDKEREIDSSFKTFSLFCYGMGWYGNFNNSGKAMFFGNYSQSCFVDSSGTATQFTGFADQTSTSNSQNRACAYNNSYGYKFSGRTGVDGDMIKSMLSVNSSGTVTTTSVIPSGTNGMVYGQGTSCNGGNNAFVCGGYRDSGIDYSNSYAWFLSGAGSAWSTSLSTIYCGDCYLVHAGNTVIGCNVYSVGSSSVSNNNGFVLSGTTITTRSSMFTQHHTIRAELGSYALLANYSSSSNEKVMVNSSGTVSTSTLSIPGLSRSSSLYPGTGRLKINGTIYVPAMDFDLGSSVLQILIKFNESGTCLGYEELAWQVERSSANVAINGNTNADNGILLDTNTYYSTMYYKMMRYR